MQASAPVCVVTHNTDGVRRDALLHRGNRREMINRVDWPMHKLYSVNADVDTGHWLDTPEPLGEVSLAEFDKLSDTPDATFTTSRSAGGRRIRTRGPTAKGKATGSYSRQASPSRPQTCKWLRLSRRRLRFAQKSLLQEQDQWFESGSLQRRVRKL